MSCSETCPHPTALPGTVPFRLPPISPSRAPCPPPGCSLAPTQLTNPPALGDYFSSLWKHPHYGGDTRTSPATFTQGSPWLPLFKGGEKKKPNPKKKQVVARFDGKSHHFLTARWIPAARLPRRWLSHSTPPISPAPALYSSRISCGSAGAEWGLEFLNPPVTCGGAFPAPAQ